MADIDKRLNEIEKKLDAISSVPCSAFGNRVSLSEDEVDLRELWSVIWGGKLVVIATTFVFAVTSVFYALAIPDFYKSEALLAPAESNSGGGLAGLAGQFGGLASLAGVNLSGGGNDRTTLAIEVLKSREFITKFIEKRNLLVPLMVAEGWNQSENKLILDADMYDQENGVWVRPAKTPRGVEPSMQEAYRELMKLLSVSQDKKSNFVLVGAQHYSPYLAKQWVDWLVEDINDEIKTRDVLEARKSIEYLSSQLTKTSVADMQSIFYELIEEQSKTIMFAEVRDEYVFKTIDEAVVPDLKFKPNRSLICVFGAILGGVFGVFYVLVRHFIRKNNFS